MIDAAPERTNGKMLQKRASGRLDFVNVGFSYPGQSQLALSDINLTVMPGETVAFVGMSGGGKSTLVNLVPNFYSVGKGEIKLDGEPIEQISLESLRTQMAMVSQNVVLFDDTVAANIGYGREGGTLNEIMEAAKSAAAHEFISQLPNGYDTRVGEAGLRLSGGHHCLVKTCSLMPVLPEL